jgi:NADH dehydrogenase
MSATPHHVVIIGGGAGGLELAVRLGRRFGRDQVTLVDRTPSHIWKPSLHEAAAGTLDIHREGLSYAMLGQNNGFRFVFGAFSGLDRARRTITVAALNDASGAQVLPERQLPYDTLVLAVGSHGNFFNTPGAERFALSLDSTASAEQFRVELLKAVARADTKAVDGKAATVQVVIVGGGATGVELAAELHEAGQTLSDYGSSRPDQQAELHLTVIEGGPRILGPLPERVAAAATQLLCERGVAIHTRCRVSEVQRDAVMAGDKVFPADLVVWAAGIKAPAFLATLGLAVTPLNQLVVNGQLRTEDPAIVAFGDCAAAPWEGSTKTVPPRAQAAHQQSSYLYGLLSDRMRGRPVSDKPFRFRDFGSLVSIGHTEGVGSLMGGLSGPKMQVEGWIARVMYASSHWSHYVTVLGLWHALLRGLARTLNRRSQPRVKLH